MSNTSVQNKSFALESRYVVVANIYPSKSKKTIKILDLEGHLLGIALRDEIIQLLNGYLDHANIVIYRCDSPQTPLEGKAAEPEKIKLGDTDQ